MKNKIVSVLLVLSTILLASGCGGGEKHEPEDRLGQQSYTEIAEILKQFGIGGITEQLIRELETADAGMPQEVEFNKTAGLLSVLGLGEYNYSEGTWTPSANGVYSFDVEVLNLDRMYTDFLRGVSALDKDELDFQNIQEDTSDVDLEEGTGIQKVTFEWKGKTYCLEATVENDWFDMNVAFALNKIIIENGNGKRLFFTSDGYQQCIVFYRDSEWAKSFEKETGLVSVRR